MSRFGWAYVNDIVTGSGGTPGGSDKAIQFASGSTFSGSTNFTFDYNSNTVRLTGTLYADNLIVSSSQILKSGSTIFGDDLLDTHQFTGSVYVTGVVSSSTGIQTAGAITSQGLISSSLGFQTNTTVQAAGNITSQAIISSSNGFQTNTTVDAQGNIRSTSGDLSSSVGIQTGGFLTVAGATNLKSGLTVTGSSYVQALSSSAQIQATSFAGNGFNITGIQASNVDGAGDDWSIQFKDGLTGTLTGSSNLLFSGSTLTLTGSLLMSGTSYISEVDYIDFDVSASIPAYKAARIFHDTNTNDLSYYLPLANQALQIGQQTVIKVKNSSGSPISKGKLVHITGGVGDNPLINTASWENDSNSANTLGMLMSTVADGEFGYALLNGVLTGLNTNPATYSEGQVIYLSSSGDYTNATPVAPYHTVRLGQVIRAHTTVGSIFVKIDNGYEIDELHNVLITSASTGDLLTYNSSSAVWQNTKTLSGSYTVTGSLTLGSTSTLSVISGNLSTGATVVSHTIPSNAENFTVSNEYNDKLLAIETNATKDIVRIGPVSSTPGLTTEIYIQGNPGDAFLEVSPVTTFLSNLSGTTSQFAELTGSTVTGSTARFTTITGSTITSSNFVGNGSNLTNVVPSFSTKQITTVYPMGGDTSFCILGVVPTPIKQTNLSAYYNTTNGTGGGTEYTVDTNGVFARLKTRSAASVLNSDATTIKINGGVASAQIASGSQIATLTTVLKTDTVINDQIITFGFTNFDNFNNSNGASATNKAAFINYDPSGSLDTTWKLVTINGSGAGARTRADTGVTVSTGSIYNVAITLSGTDISCNINGTIITASATKPDGLMAPQVGVLLVSGSVQRSLYTKGFELIQNF